MRWLGATVENKAGIRYRVGLKKHSGRYVLKTGRQTYYVSPAELRKTCKVVSS